MAETIRKHDLEIPLYTRTSDAKSLRMCQLQWFLSYYYGSEIPDATYFLLGDKVHTTIEQIITDDLSLADAEDLVGLDILIGFNELGEHGWVETSRRPANVDELISIGVQGIDNWWADVHPSSKERNFAYTAYDWPPRVEHIVHVPARTGGIRFPIRSEIDTIFSHSKTGDLAVVDWKSGATAKADPVQLWLYHWELKNDPDADWYPMDTPFNGWFHHVLAGKYGGKIQEVGKYPGDEAMQHTIRWVEEQKQLGKKRPKAAFPPYPEWWCKTCRAKEHCPVFGATLDIEDLLSNVSWLEEPYEKE